MPPASPVNPETRCESARRRAVAASVNSVSTRIVLCVFGSTLLTALIVSWLSIGAIHRGRSQPRRSAERSGGACSTIAHACESTACADRRRRPSLADGDCAPGATLAREAPARARVGAARDVDSAGTGRRGPNTSALRDPRPPQRRPCSERTRAALVPPRRLAHAPRAPRVASRFADRPDRRQRRRRRHDRRAPFRLPLARIDSSTYLEPGAMSELLRGLRLLVVDRHGQCPPRRVVCVPRNDVGRSNCRCGRLAASPTDGTLATILRASASGERVVGVAPAGSVRIRMGAGRRRPATRAPTPRRSRSPSRSSIVDVCIILLFSVLAYKIAQAVMRADRRAGARRAAHRRRPRTDYEIPLPENHDDELGLLDPRTFNGMMRKLRSNQLGDRAGPHAPGREERGAPARQRDPRSAVDHRRPHEAPQPPLLPGPPDPRDQARQPDERARSR